MTKLVKSPGGDSIEVIPDPEFLEVFEANPYDLRQWNKRRAIFTALWKHGAYVDKASGRATAMLTNDTRNLGRMASPAAFNGMFASSPTVAACIERDINGKRTYRIQLMRLPELYYNKLLAVSGGANKPKPEPEPEPYADAKPEVFVLEVAPEPAPAFDSMAVAQHLLGLVIDKINEPTPEPVILEPSPDMKELGRRLAEQTEYGQRMREEARKISVKLSEVTAERDQLGKELSVMRARFDQALTAAERLDIDTQLRRLMEGKPSSRGD